MGKRLQAFASSARFSVHGNTVYGFENDIYFNVDWVKYYGVEGAFVTVTVFLKQVDPAVFTEFKRFIKDNKKRFRANNVSLNDSGITAVVNAGATRIKPEMVLTFMRETAIFFKDRSLVSSCAFCDQTENMEYIEQNGLILPVCTACGEKYERITRDIIEERETTGSYFRGLVGAIIGGVLGVIPWILVGMLGYVAAICGFFMAFLCYKGYLLLKGKRSRGMIVILVLVLLVMTYVAVITSGTVAAYRELVAQGYDVDALQLFKVMMAAPFLPADFEVGPLWGEIAMGWLFTGLGSFFFLRKVGREGTGKDITVKRISDDLPR